MDKLKKACIEATWVFLLSRLAILVITYIGVSRFIKDGGSLAADCTLPLRRYTCAWFHYDAIAYVNVAHNGYAQAQDTVFFPLWPLLIHTLGSLAGSSIKAYYVAGLLLSNLCFFFALILFYILVDTVFDGSVAKKALFFLAFSPYAIFFFLGYTESLFLMLCLATFLFLYRGRAWDWWLASLCIALATATRATGCILVVPFLVTLVTRYWPYRTQWRRSWPEMLNAVLSMAIIPLGLGAYLLYLWQTKGDPFIFRYEEAQHWGRYSDLPWVGMKMALKQVLTAVAYVRETNLTDLTFMLIPIGIVLAGWRRVPLSYTLFALATVLFFLINPVHAEESLGSTPRYMLVVFPVYIICALWSKNTRVQSALLIFAAIFFTINLILFISHSWVA